MTNRKAMVLVTLFATVAAGGCGQTLHIKATRLGSAMREFPDPAGEIRQSLRAILAARLALSEKLADIAVEISATSPLARDQVQESRRDLGDLADPDKRYDLADLIAKKITIQQGVEDLLTDQTSAALVDNLERANVPRAKIDKLLTDLQRLRQSLQGTSMQADIKLARVLRTTFGGFASDSIYIINPGSEEWEKVNEFEHRSDEKLVFSSIKASAFNDSVLMVVQESPGQFEPRYIEADPENAIRNALIAMNWILRIAAKIVPYVSIDLGPLSTTGPTAGPTGTAEPTPIDEAEARLTQIDSDLKALASDAAFKEILEKAARSSPEIPLSLEDQNALTSHARRLMSILGIGHKPSYSR